MTGPSLTKEQILQDMESIFQKAFADGKWQIALRTKELQSKILGFFQKVKEVVVSSVKNSPSPVQGLSRLPRQQRRYQMRKLMRGGLPSGTGQPDPEKNAKIVSG